MVRPCATLRRLLAVALFAAGATAMPVHAAQTTIAGPPGSIAFGTQVHVLPNGNFVVTDPQASFPFEDMGAVYLYAADGALIGTLTGSTAGDAVGSGGVTVLANGNFVVLSPGWDAPGGVMPNVGAATFVSGTAGLSAMISPANSLVGSTGNDFGSASVVEVGSSNYVVVAPAWRNGTLPGAGAVAWGSGTSGVAGAISAANALVGTSMFDGVGSNGVTRLVNGHYVVHSTYWSDPGGAAYVGAATWANGDTGLVGPVTAANSLVGSTENDFVSTPPRVTPLANGNYVVSNPGWDNGAVVDAGAATWVDGTSGTPTGPISAANSLVGSTDGEAVGGEHTHDVVALANGNYVVVTRRWTDGVVPELGAATWGDGSVGVSGVVSAANSLTGALIAAGPTRVTALTNGHYVVVSHNWHDGIIAGLGAATWVDGTSGLIGTVDASNSLVGDKSGDGVGSFGIVPLDNGNYVVVSSYWDNGAAQDAGAVTWADGSTGLVGVVSPANSLVGTAAFDSIGFGDAGAGGVFGLADGHYVIASPLWDAPGIFNAGAVTWADGATGSSGDVTGANSLTGSAVLDGVGSGILVLDDGHYVVRSPAWSNGAQSNAGAVTRVEGTAGLAATVSTGNSLYGTASDQRVGGGAASAYSDGNYSVLSPQWDDGASADVGAATLVRGSVPSAGPLTQANSVIGTVPGAGASLTTAYDATRSRLVVGQPAANLVTLLTLPTVLVFADGFE